jgi:uncharacterized protein
MVASDSRSDCAMALSEPRSDSEMIVVRRSNVHGLGVFANRAIPKGTRIVEYTGERVSHAEADSRYEEKDANDGHTFLFIVDSKTVIDAGVDGNDARFINHSCNPNCESVIENRRVYIEAIRDIGPGEELTYDYQIQREDDDPEDIDAVFACRCGFPQCRGTMLWPTERKPNPKSRAAERKPKRSSKTAERKSKRKSSVAARKSYAGDGSKRTSGRGPAQRTSERRGRGKNSANGLRAGHRSRKKAVRRRRR